jgi:plasmid stability protein
MASLTIRLDEATKARLGSRAEQHGRSVEDEAREILEHAVAEDKSEGVAGNLWDRIREIVEPYGGFELPEIDRKSGPERDPPTFD